MRSQLSIDIAAPPARVFNLAADIGKWPDLLPHYRKVTIESRNGRKVLARMVAVRAFGRLRVPVTWRAEQWADDSDPSDLRLHFHHVRGVTRGMDVTWHIEATPAGRSRVSIVHVFARRVPLLGDQVLPRFVDRFFVKPIASRTLATFKRLAEASS